MFYKNHKKPKAFLFVTKKGEDYCKDTKLNHKVYKIKDTGYWRHTNIGNISHGVFERPNNGIQHQLKLLRRY